MNLSTQQNQQPSQIIQNIFQATAEAYCTTIEALLNHNGESEKQARRIIWMLTQQLARLEESEIASLYQEDQEDIAEGISRLQYNMPLSPALTRWVMSIRNRSFELCRQYG